MLIFHIMRAFFITSYEDEQGFLAVDLSLLIVQFYNYFLVQIFLFSFIVSPYLLATKTRMDVIRKDSRKILKFPGSCRIEL